MTDESRDKIILSAGGTGGHFFPAKALAGDLAARGFDVHFITDKRGLRFRDEVKDFATLHVISSGTLKAGIWSKAKAVGAISLGMAQAGLLLNKLKPAAVVGFGGYPSFPALFMAQRLNVPTILHEQNAVMGRANKYLADHAYRIALSLPDVFGIGDEAMIRAVVTGNPVREAISDLYTKPYSSPKKDGPFHILVMGGSLGASVFADVVPKAIQYLPKDVRKRIRIVQQCREENIAETHKMYEDMGLHFKLAPFFKDVADELAQAHLVICRAGASTVAEVTTAGRPAIFVPYPHHKDQQQLKNAQIVSRKGGAWVMPEKADAQDQFTAENLAEMLSGFMQAPQKLFEAAEAARGVSKPDAARKLGNLVTAVAQGWDRENDPHLNMTVDVER